MKKAGHKPISLAFTNVKHIAAALLAGSSAVAFSQGVIAQEAGLDQMLETVVVTGSRVIASADKSPTPLTMVTLEQIQATTPSNIPDALNKLPVFQGSLSPTAGAGQGGGTNFQSGNVLNLRNFGGQRTLILLDGHRVTPANADGTVDVDTLPQMLVSRVEVVTGGASAVYGSDAVTGVVNFVLNKEFQGIKADVSAGISDYGDGASYKFGLVGGTALFGGHGHIEGSLRHTHSDIVLQKDRPYGSLFAAQTGAGTAANPFAITLNTRYNIRSYGGKITCSGVCPANNMQFVADSAGNVSIVPFNNGTATGTTSLSVGGDGTDNIGGAAISGMRNDEAFGRFSYNLDDSTSFYIQASGSEAHYMSRFLPNNIAGSTTAPGRIFVNNPYLTAAQRAMFGTATNFSLGKLIVPPEYLDTIRVGSLNRNLSVTTGVDGSLFGKYDWSVFYTHGDNRLKSKTFNNTNNQRLYAALDAVKDSSGNIVCYPQTTSSASAYAGCVPMNPFGVTITPAAYKYYTGETWFTIQSTLDDAGGSISGAIFDLPAGPVKAALSAEARWMSYDVGSNADPTAKVDCTNLRLCSTSSQVWTSTTVSEVTASENVWEIALETDVPVVNDLPLIQSFDVNLAGRYTEYSTSGSVETWKIGLDWHLSDDIRFRATNSVDIRAPTLNDLYLPLSVQTSGFTDLLTSTGGIAQFRTQGNPNLVPEAARTYTAGVVLTPRFAPGLSVSLDYYRIVLKNAIGQLTGNNSQIQNLCIASGGSSPYCSLFVRPYPMSNTTAANYPTAVLVQNLNTAFQRIEGWDFETNYNLTLSDFSDDLAGTLALRGLINYQPLNQTQQFPGSDLTTAVTMGNQLASKTHATFSAQYQWNMWSFTVLDHWFSGFNPSTQPGMIIFSDPSHIRSFNSIDVNVDRTIEMGGGIFDVYLNVQNLANAHPPIYTNIVVAVGEWYPTQKDEDRMGRYYTLGIRAKF